MGALHINFTFKSDWHGGYSMIMFEIILFRLRHCFWKFPEIVWPTMNCR